MKLWKCLVVALSSIAVSSCVAESEDESQEGALTQSSAVQWISMKDASVMDRASCLAGNGSHRTGSFRTKGFSAKSVQVLLKSEDKKRDCPGRLYSKSREDAVEVFKKDVQEDVSFTSSLEDCEDAELKEDLEQVIADPANLAVISSVNDPNGGDDPVSCAYYTFYVMRADGTALRFDFDYGD
jgi:hypothetical protein